MHLSLAESLAVKAFGALSIALGANIAIKRLQAESDPERSNDPMIVKGITWLSAGLFVFVGYKALTHKS